MKILYLSEMLGPHDWRFLSMYLELGHDVTLVTYRKSLEESGMEGKTYDVRNLKGLKIVHSAELADNTLVNMIKRVGHFRSVLKAEKPDLLHAGWIQTSGFLAALSGFHPFILMPWGSDIIHFSKNCLRNRIVTYFTIHSADMVTCDCEYEKRIVADDFNYPPDRVFAMPWAVDFRFFNKDATDPNLKKAIGMEGKKLLLMMRIFRPEYGIEDFIRALPMVRKENPDARAVMIGYGPMESELKKLASGLGLDDFIYWPGYLPQSEIVKYMNISDVYVSTSLRDGSSSSLLEAMACGLPVVASDIPGNLEWIEDGLNGAIVKKSDPVSVASGINKLLKDESLRRTMSQANARKIKEMADFRNNFLKLDGICKELIKNKKAQ